jgi:hypothetical protein
MQQNFKLDIWDILFACLYGLFFTHIILGAEKINPLYTKWLLLPGSDYSYHYLAWEYFKDTPWTWPIGRIEGYAYPMYNSVMYTDSIPLLAFLFKIVRNFLPADFQYFGIWYYLCYLLNGFLGICIARRIGFSRAHSWLVSVFFFGAVVLVARFGHAALCGQWLLLWCLYLFISRGTWSQKKININLYSVVAVGSLIHPYLLFMILGLTTAVFYQLYIEKQSNLKSIGLHLLTLIGISALGWYSSGAFLFKGQLSEGLGKFSANLNTFINAWDVGALGPVFNYKYPGQGEGIGYLGLAIIILFILFFIRLLAAREFRVSALIKNCFFLACILFFVFALSPKWALGNHLIIDWKYNDYISRTFRGTGRFIWPLYYYIMYWTFKQLYFVINGKIQITIILISAVLLQAFDLNPIWVRNKYVDLTPAPLPYENEMKSLISRGDKVLVYPPYTASISDFCDYIHFVNMAQHYKKPITTGYGARFPVYIGTLFSDSTLDLTAYARAHPFDVILTNVDSLSLHKELVSELGGRSFQFERYRMFVTGEYLNKFDFIIDSNAFKTIATQYDMDLPGFLSVNSDKYILGVLQQEGLGRLSMESKALLKSYGSKIDSIGFGDSWLFVIHDNKISTELYSKSDVLRENIRLPLVDNTNTIQLISGGHNTGNPMSGIKYKNIEYSLQKRGLNFLVLDSTGKVDNQVNYDTYISDRFFSK